MMRIHTTYYFTLVVSNIYQYAIRHTIRNHEGFKSEEVIKLIAGLIDEKHQVNLSKPDKVILVEIFQVRH